MSDLMLIEIPPFDAGCLRPLLQKEIASVDRLLSARGRSMPSSQVDQANLYRRQLVACLAAVDNAHAALIGAERKAKSKGQ